MDYTAMLAAAIAEQDSASRGAALRGGIPDTQLEPVQESARQRIERLGRGLGVSMAEWLQFYATDLEAIEQDAELTDHRLLAFMQDYAYRIRGLRKPGHNEGVTVTETETDGRVPDYQHHYPAALAALQAVFAEHRHRLVSAGYPATQARVSIGDWVKICRRKAVPEAVINEMATNGVVATLHGFVVLSEPGV